MWRKEDYTGKRFGKWLVVGVAPNHITKSGYPVSMWDCVCDCGTQRSVRGNDLRLGKSVSCGCSLVENPSSRKHGMSNSNIYKVYYGMLDRCNNPHNKNYAEYGGRGISVEWDNFDEFLQWANKSGYAKGLTIERVDVNGNYSPSNCKWITQRAQTRNKRSTVYLVVDGEKKCLVEWAEQIGAKPGVLRSRKQRGWSDSETVRVPIKRSCRQ